MQDKILSELQRGPRQSNRLLWELAIQHGRITRHDVPGDPLPQGALDTSFYKSFLRAVSTLCDDGRIVRESRKLRDIDEVVDLYPFKTRDVRIHELRLRVLPVVRRHLLVSGDREYDRGANEIFHIDRAIPDHDRAELWQRWRVLEKRILSAAASSDDDRDLLIAVVARGRQLFFRSRRNPHGDPHSSYRYQGSLEELLSKLASCPGTTSLAADLLEFYVQCFPASSLKHLELKSQLYVVWDSGRDVLPKLKSEFKQYLLKEEPSFITSLPQHAVSSGERRDWTWREERFDPILDQLFGRDVFGRFNFLALAPARPGAGAGCGDALGHHGTDRRSAAERAR